VLVKEIVMRSSRFLVMIALLVMLAAPSPSLAQTVKTLYSFTGANSSGNPGLGALAQGRNGKLYGTTIGPSGADGSAFAITTSGKASQLYAFGIDGANPWAGLTLGADGYYYGTTFTGGSTGNGVLFKLSPTGAYTSLHEFAGGSDGAMPLSPPIQGSDSNFYGTTSGTSGASTIYRYGTNGTFTTILNFTYTQGQYVFASLIQGTDGNLYGTAEEGGNANECGTIFKLSTSGQMLWTYSFPCGGGGAIPYAPLLQASDGNFYGTTISGGGDRGVQPGTVFRLDQNGNVTILYSFKNLTDGAEPAGGLTQGTDGNLYGTTLSGGGKSQGGNLFQISLGGVHTVLYYFGASGKEPYAGVTQDTNGIFYGTTYAGGRDGYGSVYSLNMGLGPFVTFVQPTAAVGGTAQILGQGLTGATSVTFNGVPATSFKVVNDTYMTSVVPSGATTGKVVVTTPGGTLTSNVNFRILQ
jgi:uncharacterized repeat protein (TIGR03803 family)